MSILYVVRGDNQLNAWLNVTDNDESMLREIVHAFLPTKAQELQSFPPSKSDSIIVHGDIQRNAWPKVDSKDEPASQETALPQDSRAPEVVVRQQLETNTIKTD